MSPRPEAIDSRLVFRIYAAVALPLGLATYMWPTLVPTAVPLSAWVVRARLVAAVVTAFGTCAAAFAAIEDPIGRRRGLLGFAHAHIMLGAMLIIQARAEYSPTIAPRIAWTALIVGVVLLYLAITGPGSDFPAPLRPLAPDPAHPGARGFVIRNKPTIARLRSEYEQQIRAAARQEERARLARDLHDAVKQQLFAIQTAAATVQARFDADPAGARLALEQVRSAAREAMTEMEAMLDQLQAAPIENAGLVAFLRKQCEALGFQTGAKVTFTVGTLPAETAVDPSVRQTMARVAQEALSNVARHARASNVSVSLGTSDGRLVLTVKDDGSGFVMEQEPRRMGMGMHNLAVRAAEVGGNVDIVGAPGSGTTVRFSVPSREAAKPRAYAVRAIAWAVTASAVFVLLSSGSTRVKPVAVTVGLIGAIAVARNAAAAYSLSKPGQR